MRPLGRLFNIEREGKMDSNQTVKFVFRALRDDDGPRMAELMERSPDTGAVHYALQYQVDPLVMLRLNQGEDYLSVVAEDPISKKLVGICLGKLEEAQFNGKMRKTVYLNSLAVHVDHRRKALATELVRRILLAADQEFGEESTIWAAVQSGNVGSERTIQRFLDQNLNQRFYRLSFKTRSNPPRKQKEFTIRSLREDDFPSVVAGMNQFYSSFHFYSPYSEDKLSKWLNETPFPDPYRTYRVVEDSTGKIVAGGGITNDSRLRVIQITGMPAYLRVMNWFFGFVPEDQILRDVTIEKFWFHPGKQAAASYFWEMMRWEAGKQGNSLQISIDAGSPLMKAIRPRFWTPKTVQSILIRDPETVDPEGLIYL
jgi:ribosomal protein S18 acetylase RimI-like enzyme